MFLPAEYAIYEPVVIAAAIVFVVALIGNVLSFSSRFGNAFLTAVIFAAIFGVLAFVSKVNAPPPHFLPGEYAVAELVLIAAAIVFVVDLLGNLLSFSNRFVSALVTAIVFAAVFGGLTYVADREGIAIPAATDIVPAPVAPTPTP
ncbi:hypothetical protein [Hyphomicrobium sp.]|uniref:hypothetical protein n=1 Tax=Hyphomicrobium sp. TaxID=82 RepID=UPI003F6E5041